MTEIGTITLYREKSVVHKFDALIDKRKDKKEAPVLTLRSNRVTIPIKAATGTIIVVVRAQNIPGTMRMASIVVEEFCRVPDALRDPRSVDWDTLWQGKTPKLEADTNPHNWVMIHIGGELVFASGEGHKAIEEIERLSHGGEVTESSVREASANILGTLESLVVQHDNQAAFVFTPGAQHHRAAILERHGHRTGAYSMAVYHSSSKKPVSLAQFISFCADVTEALTHKAFLDRVQELAAQNALGKTNILPSLIQATQYRRKELIYQIAGFEEAKKVVYRPEKPALA